MFKRPLMNEADESEAKRTRTSIAELSPEEAFKQCAEEGNWESIKARCLTPNEAQSELQEFGGEILRNLIKFGDIIDFRMYRRAVEAIFPLDAYNLSARVNGDIDKKGQPTFIASCYEFIVTCRASQPLASTSVELEPKCIIKINAPGSRTLTSDIDTSIATTLQGDVETLLEHAHERIKQGVDYAGRITNSIIDGFYVLSEQEFGITSAEHRDSNAYIDLTSTAIEVQEYPKFRNDEIRNPLIGEKRLFENSDLSKKLSDCKKAKHRLEIAASLFSLRLAPSVSWEEFKGEIDAKIQAYVLMIVDGETDEGRQKTAKWIADLSQDLAKVYEKVEEFFSNYQQELAAKVAEIRQSSYGQHSPLPEGAQEKDFEVAALNRLYVEYLEQMIRTNESILQLENENKRLLSAVKPFIDALSGENLKLTIYKQNATTFTVELPGCKNEIARLKKEESVITEQLRKNILQIAKLQIKKLEERYRAHTFANQAYVCRSAVYHVVNGMQQSGTMKMSDQTLLGSILQQIGFKFLHSAELMKRNKSPEEVAYRTAKYGQRVHDLLFDNKEITDKQISLALKRGKSKILPRLKSEAARKVMVGDFSESELLLVNTDMKIISQVKQKTEISDSEKYAGTAQLLHRDIPSFQPFLPLASKVLAGVYLSRLDRKGALWGESAVGFSAQVSPQKPPNRPATRATTRFSSDTGGALASDIRAGAEVRTVTSGNLGEQAVSDNIESSELILTAALDKEDPEAVKLAALGAGSVKKK